MTKHADSQKISLGKHMHHGLTGMRPILTSLLNSLNLVRLAARAAPRAISFYRGSYSLTIFRTLRIFAREGLSGVLHRIHILLGNPHESGRVSQEYDLPEAPTWLPYISIIVPNFNHAQHLKARLDSIDNQTYQHYEVILLDDASQDNSVTILQDYANRNPHNTRCHFNRQNSGSVFKQWRRGLELAKGDLIWIAESDDICSDNFLQTLVQAFRNPAVMLAFARTEFIRGMPPETTWDQQGYLADLGHDIWQQAFIKSAHNMLQLGWSAKNLAPNVSGVLFRKPAHLALLDNPTWLNMKLCGDWVFYLHLIRGGLVAYCPEATNYYRQHDNNTSVNAQSTTHYYREHEVVATMLAQIYPLELATSRMQEQILFNHWCRTHAVEAHTEFAQHYCWERIQASPLSSLRKPHIAMAIYAFSAGGGETFPIHLANQLWQRGYTITVINFQGQPTEPGVRNMLLPGIPLINLSRIERVGELLQDLGVELVHSHHAWVDTNLATFLSSYTNIRHIVTMHGMYEMMEPPHFNQYAPLLQQRIDGFVYIAEKNLLPFPQAFWQGKSLTRIDIALPSCSINSISRSSLGLSEQDFVLCMAARAIPEKGWEQAIASVIMANQHSQRKVHLLLLGAGAEEQRLKALGQPDCIHFLGYRANVSDYFALADIGLLPTRFKGESTPLVLIECLLAGRPMIATAIGDIPYMLSSSNGMAGITFALEQDDINIHHLAHIINATANDQLQYSALLMQVASAAEKFDINIMLNKYTQLYSRVLCLQAQASHMTDGVS